jgi:hypothetical protein
MASMENAAAPQPATSSMGSTVSAGAIAGAGLFSAMASGYASQAQGYYQQAAYAAQATENMRLTGLRADKAVEYAVLQADRKTQQTEFEVLNYKMQGNTLLRSLAKTNAAARARVGANGMASGSGTAISLQQANAANVYRDVGITDLNALVARVFGAEDATNILKAGFDTAFYEREAAIGNTKTLLQSGSTAAKTGGLMQTATLIEGGIGFAKTFPTASAGQAVKSFFS